MVPDADLDFDLLSFFLIFQVTATKFEFKKSMCILNGNMTQTQAKTQSHNAHVIRPKQERK